MFNFLDKILSWIDPASQSSTKVDQIKKDTANTTPNNQPTPKSTKKSKSIAAKPKDGTTKTKTATRKTQTTQKK